MSAAPLSHRAPDAAPLRERLAGLRHDPRVPDALIVLGVAAAMAIEIQTSSALSGPRAANLVFAAAVAAPLAWRRSSPLLAALAVYVAAAVGSALLTPLGSLVTPLIILVLPPFALGEAPRRTVAVAGLAVCLAGLVALGAATPDGQDDGSTVAALMLVVISWTAGFGYARLAARTRELQRRIFEIEQRQLERQAVQLAAERRRIGRELHDTIAHGMSAVVLQAAAGRRIFDADPAGARRALGAVSETARHTLEECRRSIVGLGGEAPLGELLLDSLIERARAAGITVDLRTVGSLGGLSAERGMVAYRVIQEALTNVSRHAAPTHATVRILAGEDGVELEVVDRGRMAPAPTEVRGSGRGLQSMRERVEHSGGTLEAGPLPGRGFQVRARLPAGARA